MNQSNILMFLIISIREIYFQGELFFKLGNIDNSQIIATILIVKTCSVYMILSSSVGYSDAWY